jgi:hypothetical protein
MPTNTGSSSFESKFSLNNGRSKFDLQAIQVYLSVTVCGIPFLMAFILSINSIQTVANKNHLVFAMSSRRSECA